MIEIENTELKIIHLCSGLIINNIMLQILNLSMASKKIGFTLPAFRNVSIPPSPNSLKKILRTYSKSSPTSWHESEMPSSSLHMIGTPGPQSVFATHPTPTSSGGDWQLQLLSSLHSYVIASVVADFSHNMILREEVCSVRIIISITNVLQPFSQNNSLKMVCTYSLSWH